MRKLVQLDDDSWGCTEIDMVKLQRMALEFKVWLLTVDPTKDVFGFFVQQDLPVDDAALAGRLTLPYKGFEPHTRELGEGWLPREYTQISTPFYNTIREADRSIETVQKDGKRFAWAEFEEP